jgi:hypothetical protein
MTVVARLQSAAEALRTAPNVRWTAVAAWALGALVARQFEFLLNDALEGLLLGFVTYLVLSRITSLGTGRREAAVPGRETV